MLTVFLIVLFFVLMLALPTVIHRHAILQVISIFREHEALDSQFAKTIDQLGLRPPNFGQQLLNFRDHKPRALQALMRAGIVRVTDDDRLFLDETKIANLRPFKL